MFVVRTAIIESDASMITIAGQLTGIHSMIRENFLCHTLTAQICVLTSFRPVINKCDIYAILIKVISQYAVTAHTVILPKCLKVRKGSNLKTP